MLAQDFRDFELLIVDDCSTDNTAEVARPWCAKDPRVHFSANAVNRGMVNNWNHCLQQARGEYVKFVFGDDTLPHPQALGKLAALLKRHPSAVLAASARAILDEDSKVVDVWRTLRDGVHNGRKIIAGCLIENGNLVGEPSAVLFRKSDAGRGFDATYQQIVDIEMWLRMLEGGDLAYTREPLCAFRQHPGQQTVRNQAGDLARKEHLLYFSRYASQAWIPRRAGFSALYALRRALRKQPALSSPEIVELEHRLTGQVGANRYLFHWLYYKLASPFDRLKRSAGKRWVRWGHVPPPPTKTPALLRP